MKRKLIYQSAFNPAIQVETADEAEALAAAQPENLEFREWHHVLIIEVNSATA